MASAVRWPLWCRWTLSQLQDNDSYRLNNYLLRLLVYRHFAICPLRIIQPRSDRGIVQDLHGWSPLVKMKEWLFQPSGLLRLPLRLEDELGFRVYYGQRRTDEYGNPYAVEERGFGVAVEPLFGLLCLIAIEKLPWELVSIVWQFV